MYARFKIGNKFYRVCCQVKKINRSNSCYNLGTDQWVKTYTFTNTRKDCCELNMKKNYNKETHIFV